MNDKTKPEAQAAGDGVTFWLIVRNGDVEFGQDLADLPAPASHDAQQPEAAGALAGEGNALRAIAEGNLGDGPGQANYLRIREFARAALSAAPAPAQQPAVVGDAIRSCRQWIEANRGTSLCAGGFESGMHYACIMIERSLTPAATPGDKQGRDAAQVIRDALAYVNVRTDGDLLALADRAENWIRESRVLIDMQAKLIAAQKEGNGNG